MTDNPFGPPETMQQRRRRRNGLIAAAIAVLVLVAGGIWWVIGTDPGGDSPQNATLRACGSPGSGVYEVEGECVGVTDGSYVFRPELADVQQKIAQENARVRAKTTSSVTVALLDPLTRTSAKVLPDGAILKRLEGAYTALRRANTTTLVGDEQPQIQLVLASEGSTRAQWQHVTDQLVTMSERPDSPLVAVIGLGISTAQTQQRAVKLSANNIPMVSSYLIADTLDYDNIPGLIRISPSNRYYVDALRSYVAGTDLTSGVVVRDFNSEKKTDLFTFTLADDFEKQMPKLKDFRTLQYTGTGVPAVGVDPLLFSAVRSNICASAANGLQAVLYAGREIDLGAFLDSLENRPCSNPLTILTAGLDLDTILEGKEEALRTAKLSVVVAATVDAEGWQQNAPGTPEHFREFLTAFTEQGFDPEHVKDANAITMHDALLAAAQAVHLAAPEGTESAPTAAGVHAQLLNLHDQDAVPGASGTLQFSSDTPQGYPVGKPIPVLRYPRPGDAPSRQVGAPYQVEPGPQ